MIGVNVWWVYLAPQNISHAIVLTLGNKVVLYFIVHLKLFMCLKTILKPDWQIPYIYKHKRNKGNPTTGQQSSLTKQ